MGGRTHPSKRGRWWKCWAEEMLYGTTSEELEPDERAVWVGLLCLACNSPERGTVCIAPGVPYTDEQLSRVLRVSLELLNRALLKMIECDKVSLDGLGVHITNWEHYQDDYARVQRFRQRRETLQGETPGERVSNEATEGEGEGEEEVRSTTATAGVLVDDKYGAFCTVYENNVGTLGQMIASRLAELADEYALEWFEAAVEEALGNNVRSLKYIVAILERWKRDGFRSPLPSPGDRGKTANRSGPTAPGRRPAKGARSAEELRAGWEKP